jgi:hypothetical protein
MSFYWTSNSVTCYSRQYIQLHVTAGSTYSYMLQHAVHTATCYSMQYIQLHVTAGSIYSYMLQQAVHTVTCYSRQYIQLSPSNALKILLSNKLLWTVRLLSFSKIRNSGFHNREGLRPQTQRTFLALGSTCTVLLVSCYYYYYYYYYYIMHNSVQFSHFNSEFLVIRGSIPSRAGQFFFSWTSRPSLLFNGYFAVLPLHPLPGYEWQKLYPYYLYMP